MLNLLRTIPSHKLVRVGSNKIGGKEKKDKIQRQGEKERERKRKREKEKGEMVFNLKFLNCNTNVIQYFDICSTEHVGFVIHLKKTFSDLND